MKSKFVLFFIASICVTIATSAQDKRAKIKDYINQEIIIIDGHAGQSITLIKENKEYYILRKYFGSGIPVVDSAKYKVEFNSDYQIAFSDPIEGDNTMKGPRENFVLSVREQGLCLYLNNLKVVLYRQYIATPR